MSNKVTVKESIFINIPCEDVWDYTQDYSNRVIWDDSVLDAEIMQNEPNRVVRVKSHGNLVMNFEYKLEQRPERTTLAIIDSNKNYILGGGGSWKYENQDNGTLWTQTNTLVFKDNFLFRAISPFLAWFLKYNTLKAMKKAKKILEKPN